MFDAAFHASFHLDWKLFRKGTRAIFRRGILSHPLPWFLRVLVLFVTINETQECSKSYRSRRGCSGSCASAPCESRPCTCKWPRRASWCPWSRGSRGSGTRCGNTHAARTRSSPRSAELWPPVSHGRPSCKKEKRIQCEEYNGNFVQIEPITKRNFVAIINVIRRLRRDNGDVIDNSGGGVSSSKYNNRYYVITLRFVSRRRDSLLPRERNFQFNPLPPVDGGERGREGKSFLLIERENSR